MPFKSEAQRRLMWAKHPKIAKKWAHEKGSKNKGLPYHVKKAEEEMEDEHPNNSEILEGGKGDNKPDSKFNPEKLKEGIKHEREHTKKKQIAKEIAKDHLTEDKDYYERLEAIEKKGAFEYGFFDELHKIAAASKVTNSDLMPLASKLTDGDLLLMSGLGPRARAATFPLRMFNSLVSGALAGGLLGVPIELLTTGETGVPAITAALGAAGTGGLTLADEYKAQKRFQELAKRTSQR